MKLGVRVFWDSKVPFDKADLFDLVLTLENEEFKGQLKKPIVVNNYLCHLYINATGDWSRGEDFSGYQTGEGEISHEVPVKVGERLYFLRREVRAIQERFFIAPRNEEVGHEERSTFFYSANGIWNVEDCDYLPGDFVETLRQTAYEMQHGNPNVFHWANVPRIRDLQKKAENDLELSRFLDGSLTPFVCARVSDIRKCMDDPNFVETVVREYNEIADLAEEYKNTHEIEYL